MRYFFLVLCLNCANLHVPCCNWLRINTIYIYSHERFRTDNFLPICLPWKNVNTKTVSLYINSSANINFERNGLIRFAHFENSLEVQPSQRMKYRDMLFPFGCQHTLGDVCGPTYMSYFRWLTDRTGYFTSIINPVLWMAYVSIKDFYA